MSAFKEVVELREAFVHAKTKKAMCDLCVPFRDKYNLTDSQTLKIARQEMPLAEMVALLEKPSDVKLWQFCWWWDDSTNLSGIFKATNEEVEKLSTAKLYFDSMLPFATPITLDPDSIMLISDDPYVVAAMSEVGYNPLDYMR